MIGKVLSVHSQMVLRGHREIASLAPRVDCYATDLAPHPSATADGTDCAPLR